MFSKKGNIVGNDFDLQCFEICHNALDQSEHIIQALQNCRGLFPPLAMKYFREIDIHRSNFLIEKASKLYKDINRHTPSQRNSFILSAWEFSDQYISCIQEILYFYNKRLMFLGTPSLLRTLTTKSSNSYSNVSIDLRYPKIEIRNNCLLIPFDINTLNGSEFRSAFDICVIDPPWYLDFYKRWLAIAACYTKIGGKIAFSLFGELTRPSAKVDRNTILKFCESLGFDIAIHKDAILYEIPNFEKAILLRSKILPAPWKRADLVVATHNKKLRIEELAETFPNVVPIPPILYADVGNISFEIRCDRFSLEAEKVIYAPEGGYWMTTPSRRDIDTATCNVFTSNGARLICERPSEFYENILACKRIDYKEAINNLCSVGVPAEIFQ